jgi:hypothetical protein
MTLPEMAVACAGEADAPWLTQRRDQATRRCGHDPEAQADGREEDGDEEGESDGEEEEEEVVVTEKGVGRQRPNPIRGELRAV